MKELIEVTEDNRVLVPHLGVTLRVLLGAIDTQCRNPKRRRFTLEYKGVVIGHLRRKNNHVF